MSREEILKMAQRFGDWNGQTIEMNDVGLEQFAKAIEQHFYYDSLHTCHDECQRPACVRFREAVSEAVKEERDRTWTKAHWTEYERSIVKAEREACAQVCDAIERHKWETFINGGQMDKVAAKDCAEAIRKRGEK